MKILIGGMLAALCFGAGAGEESFESRAAQEQEAARLTTLGGRLHAEARYEAAKEAYGEALELFQTLGFDGRAALALAERGSAAQDLGQYLEAQQMYRRSIELLRQAGLLPHLARVWQNLATLHLELRQFSKAERAFQRALGILRQSQGPGTVGLLSSLGWVRYAKSDFEGAHRYYQQAFDHLAAGGEAEAAEVATLYNQLGALHLSLDETSRAEQAFRRGLEALESPEQCPVEQTNLLINLGQLYADLGDGRAVKLLEEAVAVLENNFGPEHLYVGRTLSLQAEALRKLKRKEEARQAARRGKQILKGYAGETLSRGTIHVTDLVRR